MERKNAIRVAGSLAKKCHTVFRYVSARNMGGLCMEAAINVADAYCAWHGLENERWRTLQTEAMYGQACAKMDEASRRLAAEREKILDNERQLAREKLADLVAELRSDNEIFKMQAEKIRTQARYNAEELAAKEAAQKKSLDRIMAIKEIMDGELAACNKAGLSVPQKILDDYNSFLKIYIRQVYQFV